MAGQQLLSFWLRRVVRGLAMPAVVASCARRIVRRYRDRGRADALYRLLADNSGDAIICTSFDGTRRYASPSFWTMTGWTEAELVGRRSTDIVHPDDIGVLDGVLEALKAGASVASGRYRYVRPDGTALWVEIRARLVTLSATQPQEFVGNIRDISAQKAIEDELADANAELAAMTLTDPLTAISNRRHFDQTLRKEWNRAMRNGSPLAVMMIDADHFKAFNDLYGHPLGDECLRSLAGVLASTIRRPGDLAARYGGEEFAVILPETAAETAALVAERMIASLTLAGLVHAGNESGIVTMSIGVAAMTPDLGAPVSLILEQADEALYVAKNTGRNRVVIARPYTAGRHMIAAE